MLGKLKSIVNKLRNEILQFLPFKALMVRIEGAGASDPIIQLEYNVDSVVRTGVYLIMISDLDSFETKTLKVLIVR